MTHAQDLEHVSRRPGPEYVASWKIGNIGYIGLKRSEYSLSLIQKRILNTEWESVRTLRSTDHVNLINLVEAFEDGSLYLVYNYHGFTVDLARVCARPQVRFTEEEIAVICKYTIHGLQYIHDILNVAHGDLSLRNIVLHDDGQIRIAANIGNSLLKNGRDKRKDLKNLGYLIARLSDPDTVLRSDIENARNVSQRGKDFLAILPSASYRRIFQHEFLQQARVDGGSRILIPHYLNTIGFAWPLPLAVAEESSDI
ncbi:hypothetical protein EYZ11_006000 [Aspergillus tanneri]|uniref:Protein kinase domain-containing protein n=1 Tax=Aspergillus tanneri TaxID=1220188 RepID=A0A4S3JJ13_9EURO|nr:hypothetical protein EYZ11_006000 [Aspergillus tanneri]